MEDVNEILGTLSQEFKRGTVVLSVLGLLSKSQYGYTLVKNLKEHGINVDTNTLYPLLRRLEKQGILISEWETEGSKPRKYYQRTEIGEAVYFQLTAQWRELSKNIEQLIKESEVS
jgi:DNA-binding PadR family transcriptional regulator